MGAARGRNDGDCGGVWNNVGGDVDKGGGRKNKSWMNVVGSIGTTLGKVGGLVEDSADWGGESNMTDGDAVG